MPKVFIKTRTGISAGDEGSNKEIPPLAYKLGKAMPDWLSFGMMNVWTGVWTNVLPSHVAVEFPDVGRQSINVPDIQIIVEIGRNWESYNGSLKNYLCITIVEWLRKQCGIDGPFPSFDLEIIIVDWAGVSMDRYGRVLNEW